MRHTFVKLAGLLVALALVLTGCNLIGVDPMMQLDEDFAKLDKDYATVVAEYDGGTVTKGDVIGRFASMYSYYAQMYSMYGLNMTDDVVDGLKTQAMEEAVEAVAVQKEFETRKLDLSEKQAEIDKEVETNYKTVYDSFYAQAEGKGDIKARQTEYNMYANGYSKDLFLATETDRVRREMLEESIKAEKSELSEEELQTAYEEKQASDKAAFEEDAGEFESAMASEDEIVTWIPEGYRTVKHILVKPADDVLSAVTTARTALSDAEGALHGFEDELDAANEPAGEVEEDADTESEAGEDADTEAEAEEDADAGEDAADDEGDKPARTAEEIQADIDKALADAEAARKEVETAEAACLDSVKEKTDEIYAKIEAGEDFGALIAEYGEDPGMKNEPTASRGYYVSDAPGNWDEHFNDAAMELENVGDVTMTPVISTSGVHIIRYESDVTSGPVALEEVREKLYKSTLEEKQEDYYSEKLTALVDALHPVYHEEAFTIG